MGPKCNELAEEVEAAETAVSESAATLRQAEMGATRQPSSYPSPVTPGPFSANISKYGSPNS
jgi:hypothetical protein